MCFADWPRKPVLRLADAAEGPPQEIASDDDAGEIAGQRNVRGRRGQPHGFLEHLHDGDALTGVDHLAAHVGLAL